MDKTNTKGRPKEYSIVVYEILTEEDLYLAFEPTSSMKLCLSDPLQRIKFPFKISLVKGQVHFIVALIGRLRVVN